MVTVNDGQNPSITCPNNISKTTDAGQCTAVVTYANPTSADNCSFTLTRTSPANTASGSTFAQGTTMVNWKVTDASNNVSVCDFTVTVNDTQKPTITCPSNIVRSADAADHAGRQDLGKRSADAVSAREQCAHLPSPWQEAAGERRAGDEVARQ
jgi:hypothetical protein